MSTEEGQGEKMRFVRAAKAGGRARLEFGEVEAYSPELANMVVVVRDRVRDLNTKFGDDADWALRWFSIVTVVTILVAAGAILLSIHYSSKLDDGLAGAVAVAVGSLGALAAAGAQAFGWHKRFSAMFSARWAMMALRTQIDQVVLEIVLAVDSNGKLDAESRDRLSQSLTLWTDEIARVMNSFGNAYGTALEPVSLSKLKAKASL